MIARMPVASECRRSTHSLLKSLIRFIVHRGVLVTLIQTLLLITFYAVPSNLAW